MAKVSFRVKGESSIYARITVSKTQRWECKTGFTVDVSKWSKTTGLPITKNASAEIKQLKTQLEKLSVFIYENLNKENEDGNIITRDWGKRQIDLFFCKVDKTGKSNKVTDHISEIIRTAHTRENTKGGIGISKDRMQKYKAFLETFKEFQGTKNYKLKDLKKSVFENFRTWLLDKKKYAPTTA